MIFGKPGSGKSTFAQELASITKLPLFHLDQLCYEKGWRKKSFEEIKKLQNDILQQPMWIIEGNRLEHIIQRFEAADLIVFMCPSWHICIKRIISRARNKNNLASPEATATKITWKMLKSILLYDYRVNRFIKRFKQPSHHTHFIEIHSDKDLHPLKNTLFSGKL